MSFVVDQKETIEKICARKNALGDDLLILTHHYQRKEIVDLGDFRGDSFGLSQKAAAHRTARFIIFCGVHFMAESAEILSRPQQTVQIPAVEAGCWMADMADPIVVANAWEELTSIAGAGSVVPIVYMNSDADLKAFCGKHGGTVCTSSNASTAFGWGFEQREKVFFFPDQHLGRNTANHMGIPPEEMIVWDPEKPLGGNTPEGIKGARVILWDGYCLVHTRFRTEHIRSMRHRFPEAKIVVHPECTEEVVDLADAVGSTSFIVKYVEDAPSDRPIIVGTEINLINRLALEHPDKTVLALHHSLCPNMFKISLENLLWSLDNIGKVNVITVPEAVKTDARLALDRMLALAP
ncbi:MAG: quinolinate synthase NadA [Deltaproteobacteria bacterium]|nr:quinolinate synthase NadA [Deltaproteobacteria bacterium]